MREQMNEQNQKDTVSANEKHDRKLSGAMRIFQALSSVDEELLVRSEEEKKVIPFRRYTKVMAACLCFMMLGVVMITSTRRAKDNASSDSAAAPEAAVQIADATYSENRDGATTDMEADISAGGMEAAAEEEVAADEAVEEAPAEVEEQDPENETAALESSLVESGSEGIGNKADQIHDAIGVLDEERLRATDVLGEYVPKEIPAGYVFAEGYRDDAADGPVSINLTWLNGMDYITISVKEYVEETELEERLVDEERPIFVGSDFSIDVVKARMKSVNEVGDTDTPRGNFAVLYDSGVLVEFSGRGDAESIWNMFQSIEIEADEKE